MLTMHCCFSVDLLGLLNWRSNPEALDQILQRLMEVEGSEIVKVRTALNREHIIMSHKSSLNFSCFLLSFCRILWTPCSAS